jgi:HEAT repeat protein
MFHPAMPRVLTAAALIFAGSAAHLPAAEADLAKAFQTLKTYQWGQDHRGLSAIDDAVAASRNDADARKSLESRLAAVLPTEASQAAKDYACRQLSLIGSAASVPALAALLPDKNLSHMARYALERIPGDEAVAALRDALTKVGGLQKVGVINSLGARRDSAAVSSLTTFLADADPQVAAAAAAALGDVGNSEAAASLSAFASKAPPALRAALADASLHCAERLLTAGKKAEATALYKELSKPTQPKHVRVAAMRGLLAATGKK